MNPAKVYIGAKIVMAWPCNLMDFNISQGRICRADDHLKPGYCVKYPDGYLSWSPQSTFEEAYRLVSDAEKQLIF
jgi:hypothetical protein